MAGKSLLFFGDICLENIRENDFFYGPLLQRKMSGTFNIGNLESPLTSSLVEKKHQAHVLHCRPEDSISFLKDFQVVSLANNHIQDFFDQGILDTCHWLDQCHIRYFGIGKDQHEAIQPLCMDFDGLKVAFIGASRYANATSRAMGTSPEKLATLKKSIRKLKRDGYLVIPYFHWGYMYQRLPSPRERRIAHKCIDYGADLVLGSHSHIFQAHERYRGKEIWYGLGNFIFHPEVASVLSEKGDGRVLESFILQVDVDEGNIVACTPLWYRIGERQVELLSNDEASSMKEELEKCSAILEKGSIYYGRKYYAQAVGIAKQSKKMRHGFQMSGKTSFKDKLKIYTDFNFQDVCNRVAALMPWLFQ